MSGNSLKRNSYWLRERNKKQTDVEKIKLKELRAIDYLSKHKTKLINCSFVKKCVGKAKQKKNMNNAIKYSKTSKNFSYPGVFRKVYFLMFLEIIFKYIVTIKKY